MLNIFPPSKGKVWSSAEAGEFIGEDIQRFFRQEKIDIKLLLRESDDQSKYELFQRINAGGTPLSDQEVRNCILITINRDGYFWLEGLSRNEAFTETCPLQERPILERYDIELTLRFVVLESIYIGDIADVPDLSVFLTTKLREIFSAPIGELAPVGDRFSRTFTALQQACGENAMRKFNVAHDRFTGPFLISRPARRTRRR